MPCTRLAKPSARGRKLTTLVYRASYKNCPAARLQCTAPSRSNLRGREEWFPQTCWAGAVPHTASSARAAILPAVASPQTLDVPGTGFSTKLVDPQAVFSRSLEEKVKFLRGCERSTSKRHQTILRSTSFRGTSKRNDSIQITPNLMVVD